MNRGMKGLVLACAAIVAVVAPATGAPRQRTETIAYDRPAGIHLADAAWIEVAAGELPAARPLAREKTVSVAVTDDSGRPVAGVVHQGEAELGDFCGETEAPLQLASRAPVHVHIYSGPGCSDVSTPTAGSVDFTFAR